MTQSQHKTMSLPQPLPESLNYILKVNQEIEGQVSNKLTLGKGSSG